MTCEADGGPLPDMLKKQRSYSRDVSMKKSEVPTKAGSEKWLEPVCEKTGKEFCNDLQ